MAKLKTRIQKIYNSKNEVVGEVTVTYNAETMKTVKLETKKDAKK